MRPSHSLLCCSLLSEIVLHAACAVPLCEQFPTSAECQIQPTLMQPSWRLARWPGAQLELEMAPRLNDGATALVTLHPVNGGPDVGPLAASAQDGKLLVIIPDYRALSWGPAEVRLQLGTYQARTSTLVYEPPILKAPLSIHWSGTDMPLAATVVTPAFSGLSTLFVAEQYRPAMGMFDRRRIAKYDLKDGQLVRDGTFNGKAEFSSRDSVAVTRTSVLGYYFDPGLLAQAAYAFSLSDSSNAHDAMVQTQDAQLFAVDPWGSLRLLADASRIEAFVFDVQTTPSERGMVSLQNPLSWLVARHYDLDGGRTLDAVAMDANHRPQIFALRGSALNADADLTNAATTALGSRLGADPVTGLALADLDCDGMPDLVLARANSAKMTLEILWAPYLGNGRFGDFQQRETLSVMLPEGIPDVSGLAIGDLDGDHKADVVLIGRQTVYVYLNQPA